MLDTTYQDFAFVRLTQAGLTFAGTSQTLRLVNAHSDYTFTGQQPQKVVRRGEMGMFLAYTLPDGTPAFELVPDVAAEPVIPAAAAQAIPTDSHSEDTHAE